MKALALVLILAFYPCLALAGDNDQGQHTKNFYGVRGQY
jgi:hypothetical protein